MGLNPQKGYNLGHSILAIGEDRPPTFKKE